MGAEGIHRKECTFTFGHLLTRLIHIVIMGRAKEMWIDSQMYSERTGLVAGVEKGKKYVCADLFNDRYVQDYILQHGNDGLCSYSDKHGKVVDIVDLAEWVVGKIKLYFRNPDDDGLYLANSFYDDDKEEIPGYQRVNGYVTSAYAEHYTDTAILLWQYGFSSHPELIDDIGSLITNQQWINIDSFDLKENERMLLYWNRFAEEVKRKKGYIPTDMKTYAKAVSEIGEMPFDMIMEDIKNAIIDCKLLTEIPCGTSVYRCRNIMNEKDCRSFEQITSAPSEYAFANRMSVAGDSMFYAAFNPDVSLAEAVDKSKPIKALGEFTIQKDIRVINLTDLSQPSLWGDYNYASMKFLHDFSSKISENFDDYTDSQKEIEYIPTQVFTDCIRNMETPIEGLVYYSSKIKGEKNVVLFCNQEKSKEFVSLRHVSYQKTI